jgi:glycosyltransferase involved in cell wall biosynthesis
VRILQISSARTFGGGERHLADLARALSERGHELFAALAPSSPLRDRLASLHPANVFTLPLRGALDLASAARLARLAREHDVAIIHAHVARDYTLAALAARLVPPARLVITRHVLFPLSRVHRRTLSNVARVIAVSEPVARALRGQRIFPADKIRVVTNAVDLSRFEEARARFDEARTHFEGAARDDSQRPLCVGIVGELSEVKGQADFVRAAARVAERFGEGVEFVIVGEDASPSGENRARVERLVAESGLAGRVSLTGRRDDVADLLASLDLLVSASRTEAFGMAMVEAMACGVPVVATATEGAREIVADGLTGSIVPIGDVRALAAAIISLLEDDARRRELGARARESARARFGLERMVEATERVYAEALGQAGGPQDFS